MVRTHLCNKLREDSCRFRLEHVSNENAHKKEANYLSSDWENLVRAPHQKKIAFTYSYSLWIYGIQALMCYSSRI